MMIAVTEEKGYRSPQRKLLRFFEKSRNGWKRKCQEAKTVVKRLTDGTQALRESRNRWKALAKQQRQELRELRRELEVQKS